MDLLCLLEKALSADLEWAGLRRVKTIQRRYSAKNGAFDNVFHSLVEGFIIEVFYQGQFAYAATTDASTTGLRQAAEQALTYAKTAAQWAIHSFTPATVRPINKLVWETKRKLYAEYGADLLSQYALKLSKAMLISDKIVQASASISSRDIETEFVSTTGTEITQKVYLINYDLHATARDGSIVQSRSSNGPRGRTNQGGWELLDLKNSEVLAQQIAQQAIELLTAEECPSTKADLVLMPDQMMLQIHESVGHPLELDRILGDERNFAGSSFVKLQDIGKLQYGSPLMNISFDPSIETESASYGADDIGNLARKELLIKDGILVRALGSLESQARSGKAGVANQRAEDWYRAPIDRMANLNLEPGKDSFTDIISSIENGVLMEANRSWSIDDHRNKFQFGCEYARQIKNGKLGKTLRNPNYRGISSHFWRSLFKVGNPDTFEIYGTPNCGKGEPYQVITVGHASPTCAFRDVEIFGGAS